MFRSKWKRLAFLGAIAFGISVLPVRMARAGSNKIRWDIISLSGTTISAGGKASSTANDGSEIILTGSGTFVAPASGKGSNAVTGGGTWATIPPEAADTDTATPTASGTYKVTGLVRFDESPASGPVMGFTDNIGELEDAVGGLAIMSILYSDGARGTLVVSCALAGLAPKSVFEGVTASKDFVDYWNREAPVAGIDENRTNFHIEDK